jgi:enterochelin esterase family protein
VTDVVGQPTAEQLAAAPADTGAEFRAGPWATDTHVHFQFPDADHVLSGVRLWQEARVPGDQLDFEPVPGGWRLVLDRPRVWRMEYMLELHHAGGGVETILDPANPVQVKGVFGDHSVVEFPDYVRPWWLAAPRLPGTDWITLEAPGRGGLRHGLEVAIWSPADAAPTDPLPLLLAHDGPEMAELADVTGYVAASIAAERIPQCRLALLAPGNRNARYSASPGYARTLTRSAIPAIRAAVAVRGKPVLMGASLGGLAALHAEWRYPGTFAGLFIQSGSFFHVRYDADGAGFSRFWRITSFVTEVMQAAPTRFPIPITMTCGAIEGNVDNNRLLADAIEQQGFPIRFVEVPDVHNYTAWRDAFDPYLTPLLQQVFGDS